MRQPRQDLSPYGVRERIEDRTEGRRFHVADQGLSIPGLAWNFDDVWLQTARRGEELRFFRPGDT